MKHWTIYMTEVIKAVVWPTRHYSTCWHKSVRREQEWLSPSAEGWSFSAWQPGSVSPGNRRQPGRSLENSHLARQHGYIQLQKYTTLKVIWYYSLTCVCAPAMLILYCCKCRSWPVLVCSACGRIWCSDRPHVLLPAGWLALCGESEERHCGERGSSLM